jgi:hypothetical protein
MAPARPIADEKLTFIHPDDVEIYNKWDSKTFELLVANHELLGHGSGKLFQEDADGKKNFDPDKVCAVVWVCVPGEVKVIGFAHRSSTL